MVAVVDSHAHIFPRLGERCEFLQLYMAAHAEPVRRLRDHARVTEQTLHKGRLQGPGDLRDVNFRAGKYGRLEWTANGEDLYIQFFPPSLHDVASPPELMLQQMARAGVDVAVLQNARLYGRLNEFFSAAVRRNPEKFIGLADVDEPNAHTDAEILGLRHAVRELGLRGLYFANRGFFSTGYARSFDDPMFDPFWSEVESLQIPVFWELVGVPDPTDDQLLLVEIDRLNRWARRWPSIRGVWTHGFSPSLLEAMPAPLAELLERDQFSVEVLYPIHWGRDHEYPFLELRPAIQLLYQRCGGERLIWGSDMPNVERNCTYRQSLEYLRIVADGVIPASDMDRVLGGNVMRLLE
jgi:predicted TIM-barrel fold metal-dependent hydrolase